MIMRKKTIIMLLCALTIISSVAFGTIAYLTDRDGVTNKFTIGNVDIVVDETLVDENGNPVFDEANPDVALRTDEEHSENYYPLIPGSEYTKDPTMTVKAGSEPSYVRMVVTLSHASQLKAIFGELQTQYPDYADGYEIADFVIGHDNSKWVFTGGLVEDTTANTYTLEFRYFEAVDAGDAAVVLDPLFDKILIPGELTNAHLAQLEDFYIDVEGHAIQTTGFVDVGEAWAAFDAQMEVTGE